jgi:hypothetical protein
VLSGLCGSRMVHDWTTRDTPDDGKTATRIMSHVESFVESTKKSSDAWNVSDCPWVTSSTKLGNDLLCRFLLHEVRILESLPTALLCVDLLVGVRGQKWCQRYITLMLCVRLWPSNSRTFALVVVIVKQTVTGFESVEETVIV